MRTSNQIRELRVAQGLTQQQLAVQVGVSTATISNAERGLMPASLPTRRALAEALGATVAALWPEHGVDRARGPRVVIR